MGWGMEYAERDTPAEADPSPSSSSENKECGGEAPGPPSLSKDNQHREVSQDVSRPMPQPLALQTQTPGYQAPSPSLTNSHEHTPQPILRRHLQTPSQSQNQRNGSTTQFRSGSLKLSPMTKHVNLPPSSKHLVTEGSESAGTGAETKRDISMEADEPISQGIAHSTQSQQDSQSQSQESQSSGGYRHSFFQLQTQAPYQSQSFSQSLSEQSSAGL